MKLKNLLSLFIFSAILGMSFTSCDNDDDNGGSNNSEKLDGTSWELTKVEANVEASDTTIKKQVAEFITKMNLTGGITYIFKDGNAKKKTGSDILDLAKYSFNGDKIVFEKADTTGISLTLQDSIIVGLSDVKNYVAEQLDIDTAKITKAEKIDTFKSILR